MPGLPGDLPPPGTGCWKRAAVLLAGAGFMMHYGKKAKVLNGRRLYLHLHGA